MKKIYIASLVALCLPALFLSCENENDTQKPVINLVDPAEGEILKIGGDVHLELELSDNEGLKSYKIDMHDNISNPHTHSSAAARASVSDSVLFSKTWDEAYFISKGESPIEGLKNKHIHHHLIEIPAQVNGKPIRQGSYHFIVYCTDVNGNESFVSHTVQLREDAPEHDHD